MNHTTFVGMDVHQKEIVIAMLKEKENEPRKEKILNSTEAITKFIKSFSEEENPFFCYEAGPCGYGIYRQLEKLGKSCLVAAPSLIPRQTGNRVKTDKKDAEKLARYLRSGDLTPVWVPSRQEETLRELSRAREDAMYDLSRKRRRLSSLLLRHGLRPSEKVRAWTKKYWAWLDRLQVGDGSFQMIISQRIIDIREAEAEVKHFEAEIAQAVAGSVFEPMVDALMGMKGIDLVSAVGLLAEIGDPTRFKNPKQLMSYAGLTPSEHSSGEGIWRGPITKCGNKHLRWLAIECAWHYRHQPKLGVKLKKRQERCSEKVKAISWKAQKRLHQKYWHLLYRGKPKQVAVVATARELLGFLWSVAQQVRIEQNLLKRI
jgi:transposase